MPPNSNLHRVTVKVIVNMGKILGIIYTLCIAYSLN